MILYVCDTCGTFSQELALSKEQAVIILGGEDSEYLIRTAAKHITLSHHIRAGTVSDGDLLPEMQEAAIQAATGSVRKMLNGTRCNARVPSSANRCTPS